MLNAQKKKKKNARNRINIEKKKKKTVLFVHWYFLSRGAVLVHRGICAPGRRWTETGEGGCCGCCWKEPRGLVDCQVSQGVGSRGGEVKC